MSLVRIVLVLLLANSTAIAADSRPSLVCQNDHSKLTIALPVELEVLPDGAESKPYALYPDDAKGGQLVASLWEDLAPATEKIVALEYSVKGGEISTYLSYMHGYCGLSLRFKRGARGIVQGNAQCEFEEPSVLLCSWNQKKP